MTRRDRLFLAVGTTVAFAYDALHHGGWTRDALGFYFLACVFGVLGWATHAVMQEATREDWRRQKAALRRATRPRSLPPQARSAHVHRN